MATGRSPGGTTVGDVMTEAVLFVQAHQAQEEVSELLRARGVSGAPVLGTGGKLVGVVTLSDLADRRRWKPATAGLVEDAMTRVVYAVRETDPVMVAVHLLIDEHIHRVLVVDDDRRIVGIVVPMDVLRAVARGIDVREASLTGRPVEYVELGR